MVPIKRYYLLKKRVSINRYQKFVKSVRIFLIQKSAHIGCCLDRAVSEWDRSVQVKMSPSPRILVDYFHQCIQLENTKIFIIFLIGILINVNSLEISAHFNFNRQRLEVLSILLNNVMTRYSKSGIKYVEFSFGVNDLLNLDVWRHLTSGIWASDDLGVKYDDRDPNNTQDPQKGNTQDFQEGKIVPIKLRKFESASEIRNYTF